MGSSNTHICTSPSSPPPQNVAEPPQQTKQGESSAGSTPPGDRTSAMLPDQSNIQPTYIPFLSAPQSSTISYQQSIQAKTPRNGAFANIMTSIHGVPMYSHGISPFPIIPSAPHQPETQNTLSRNSTPGTNRIYLPRIDQLYPPHAPAPSWHPSTEPLAHHLSAGNPTLAPSPFDPSRCHWRALRDVAFIMTEQIHLSPEDLCALLRFRYAKDDPQMARVQVWHVSRMHGFCAAWRKEWYEKCATGLIRGQIKRDLRKMREGGVGIVSRDF